MHKNPGCTQLCVTSLFFFVALRCCRPLGMINPEELNIEREEEIDGRKG